MNDNLLAFNQRNKPNYATSKHWKFFGLAQFFEILASATIYQLQKYLLFSYIRLLEGPRLHQNWTRFRMATISPKKSQKRYGEKQLVEILHRQRKLSNFCICVRKPNYEPLESIETVGDKCANITITMACIQQQHVVLINAIIVIFITDRRHVVTANVKINQWQQRQKRGRKSPSPFKIVNFHLSSVVGCNRPLFKFMSDKQWLLAIDKVLICVVVVVVVFSLLFSLVNVQHYYWSANGYNKQWIIALIVDYSKSFSMMLANHGSKRRNFNKIPTLLINDAHLTVNI